MIFSHESAAKFSVIASVFVAINIASVIGAERPKDAISLLAGPRLFYLDINGRLLTAKTDGSDMRILLSAGLSGPDGVAVDADAGHIYWTNMGKPKDDDGSIQRLDLDGTNLTTVVPAGGRSRQSNSNW